MPALAKPEDIVAVAATLQKCKQIGATIQTVALSSLQKTRQRGIDDRDVLRQLLLHLPRYGEIDQITPHNLAEICEWCAQDLIQLRGDPSTLPLAPVSRAVTLAETRFSQIDSEAAAVVIQRYHYLHSPRTDATASALVFAERGRDSIVAVATLSPFDLGTVEPVLPTNVSSNEVAVVSRVLAFSGTPPNAISSLLSHLYDEVREQTKIKLLVSYINPNLGFEGASLRSSGWWVLAYEQKPYYLYLDGRYITERTCVRAYGSSRFLELKQILGERISRSKAQLAPLILYAFHLEDNEHFRQSKVAASIIESPFEH